MCRTCVVTLAFNYHYRLQDMSPPAVISSRSLSLPSSQETKRRPSLIYPTRQPSQMDTPLTPPMSPKDIPIDDQCNKTEPELNENRQPQNLQTILQETPQPADVDMVDDVVHRPQRLLEDEKVHLQRSGIKLSDFEVRGTLGM